MAYVRTAMENWRRPNVNVDMLLLHELGTSASLRHSSRERIWISRSVLYTRWRVSGLKANIVMTTEARY